MNQDKLNKSDQFIKNELDNLCPKAPEGGWELLADRLAKQDALVNQDTDRILKEKLNSIAPPLVEDNGWEALNSRLDNDQSDAIVVGRLQSHQLQPPVSNWAVLRGKLELIAARRAAIYNLKFSEVCIVVASLLLFWNFFPLGQVVEEGPVASVEKIRPIAALSTETGTLKPNLEHTFFQEKPKVVATSIEAESSAMHFQTSAYVGSDTAITTTKKISVQLARIPIEPIPLPDWQQLKTKHSEVDRLLAITPIHKKPQKPKVYLRPFISPWDFNRVITPKQIVNDEILERDERISYGISGGVLLDVEYEKYDLQYGLLYAKRSYLPTVLKRVEDFIPGTGPIERRDTNYSRIVFHTLSLPIIVQKNLLNSDNWRIAVSAGLALNVNAWAKFRKSQNFDSDVRNWTIETAELATPRGGDNRGIPRLDADDLIYPEKGLFQGGSLLANTHMSISGGIHLERKLKDNVSIYVAPNFSRAIYYRKNSGAEPFNDRIHSNTIQFGTRILLSDH